MLLQLTNLAAKKAKYLINKEGKPNLKLRVYITGGGCNGLQYGFVLDDKISESDSIFEKYGIQLVTDPMSLQYLIGGSIDYVEELKGSKFVVINPNALTSCSCGSSFSI